MGNKKLAGASVVVCLVLGAAVARDADAQLSRSTALEPTSKTAPAPTPVPTSKTFDTGAIAPGVIGGGAAPPPPFVWFKFDGDLKDATGRLKPLVENYDWMKTSSFAAGRNGQAKTFGPWRQASMTPPHLVGKDVGKFFVRDAWSVAIAMKGALWGANKEVGVATGQVCATNTLFSIHGLSIYVYGCGVAATTGFLKVQVMGRDGDQAMIGGAMYDNKGIAVSAVRWNDVFVSYDPAARKLTAWLNGVAVGSAAISPLRDMASILRVGSMTEGSIDEIKYWPQTLTPASFQSTVSVAMPAAP
jgi:hypothetical protein